MGGVERTDDPRSDVRSAAKPVQTCLPAEKSFAERRGKRRQSNLSSCMIAGHPIKINLCGIGRFCENKRMCN